jgi:membrane peptidoglycan carboxypeptidase
MKKILKILFIITLIISVTGLSVLMYFFITTKDSKLDTNKLTLSSSSVTFYDAGRKEISDISLDTEKSTVKLRELPDYVKNAFISTEDKHFYDHNGIDYKRNKGIPS